MKKIARCRTAMKVLSIMMIAIGVLGIAFMLYDAFFLSHYVGTTQIQNLLWNLEAGLPSYIVIFALGIGSLWPAVTGHGYTPALVLQIVVEAIWMLTAAMDPPKLMPGPYVLADLCVSIYRVDSLQPMPDFLRFVPAILGFFTCGWLIAMMILTFLLSTRGDVGVRGSSDVQEDDKDI